MSNVINFQAKREERNKKKSKQIVIDTLEALIYQEVYQEATFDIVHDINEILKEKDRVDGEFIRAVIVLSQMNAHIWYNEDNARSGDNQGNQLMLTHGLNGIRNTAKNKIQEFDGGRKDYKIDCIASEFKDWEISW